MSKVPVFKKFTEWRNRYITDRQLILFLSVVVGFAAGMAAVIIKNLVHLIQGGLSDFAQDKSNVYFIIFPVAGILITVLFVKYINRRPVRHGIPSVLFAISKNYGIIRRHNLYSSIITSALTVGFGGSVGLEGPTVATGGAIGSSIGRLFNLNYKQIILLLGCACAGAMAAIFKAPIAAVVFALEVIMLDLTMAAIVPLLISSATATIAAYMFLGQHETYTFQIRELFQLEHIGWYAGFAIFTGLVAVYFTKMYILISEWFEKIKHFLLRLFVGGTLLGFIIFLIPALYGEGYDVVDMSLHGDYSFLTEGSVFHIMENNKLQMVLVLLAILLVKVIATSITFGSGGVGGMFAPTLFSGAVAGLLFTFVFKEFGFEISPRNFALVGMAGMISSVIHAPLTAIFLIAELTGGYQLFMPLMIVSTISYATTRIFVANSVYTIQLAKRGELMTHHKDKAALMMLSVKDLIETDFNELNPNNTLGDLIRTIKYAHRNIFPVVEKDGTFRGIVKLDDIRHIMFNPDLYENTYVRDVMFMPEYIIFTTDSVEEIARKFQESGRYNIAVLARSKYVGFISRAKLFTKYRDLIKDFSEE